MSDDHEPPATHPAEGRPARIEPDQWERLRDVRLASLRESPDMFGSSYAREAEFGEAEWRHRASRGATFVAVRDSRDVGLATLVVRDGRAELVGVWIDPAHRGQGIVDDLCDAIAAQARRDGHARIVLKVFESNRRGVDAYRRCGYEVDGHREVLPDGRVGIGMTYETLVGQARGYSRSSMTPSSSRPATGRKPSDS